MPQQDSIHLASSRKPREPNKPGAQPWARLLQWSQTQCSLPNSRATSMEYQLKEYLLLLATLVATVTYAAGLNLPGGVWQEDTHGGPHIPGDPILPDTHYRRYLAFYYCNATAFAASLVACLLLLFLDEEKTILTTILRAVMVLDLFGLMGAYAAGSCRDLFTTIYSLLLVSAVFAYITYVFITYVLHRVPTKRTQAKGDLETQEEDHDADGEPEKQDEDYDAKGDPEKQDEERDAKRGVGEQDVLILLATFVVAITYMAGLGPPGGFWGSSQDSHSVSDPIMQDHYSARYQAFFVCNTTAFVASLLVIVLLMDKELSKAITGARTEASKAISGARTGASKAITEASKAICKEIFSPKRFVVLYGFITVALTGLVGAYAAGSCREADATIYVVCLAGAVLAGIFLQVAITKVTGKSPKKNAIDEDSDHNLRGSTSKCSNRDAQQADKVLEKNRSLVMLLATLVVSITYAAGLDPPGGLWPDDRDGHKGGDPVLLATHPTRYKVFFYSNSAAFVTSLVVIIMVRSRFLLQRHILHAAMILDLFGLITAYAAGSGRDFTTSIYVVALAGVVLVYVVIHIVFFTLEDNMDQVHQRDADKLDKRRDMLLLLAILAATLTYQAGLTPPGGFWSADDKFGHRAGFPVFLDNYPCRYSAFFYCNAASFMASVTLIVLLVNPTLYKPGIRCYALYVCTVVSMFGLMGAYAAGSSRHLRTSIYVFTLVAAVFAFLTIQVVILWMQNNKRGPTVNVSSGQAACHTGTEEKNLREYLMPIGVLAASVTYQTGLKPPGGLWQDNNNGHTAGNSILHDIDRGRYRAFFYSNSTSFMASIVVIVLLLPWKGLDLPLERLYAAILLDMLGLLVAYAAGSTREWETSSLVIALVVPVLAYIAAYAAVLLFHNKCPCGNSRANRDSA